MSHFDGVISFSVPGKPISFGTMTTVFHRGGKLVRGQRKNDAAANWQAEVRAIAALAWRGRDLIPGPVRVDVLAIFALSARLWLKRSIRPRSWKTTKPDGDKIDRLVMDALEGVVYAQDAQVVDHRTRTITGAQGEQARTIVEIHAVGEVP